MKKYYIFLLVFCVLSYVNAQTTNIPAGNFKVKLLAANPNNNNTAQDINGMSIRIDVNNNNQIEVSEALSVYRLNLQSSNISSLVGIENFINLEILAVDINQLTSINLTGLVHLKNLSCRFNQFTNLDVSMLPNLEVLVCSDNDINNLNVNGLTNLNYFECDDNNLTSLDISNVPNLKTLVCTNNQLSFIDFSNVSLERIFINNNLFTSIDVSNQTNLRELWCKSNQINSINVSNSPLLTFLICSDNLITNINFNGLTKITDFECINNFLTTLDLSSLTSLNGIWCTNNNLSYLNIKNGSNEQNLNFGSNPNLQYICVDEIQTATVQSKIIQYGYPNCNVNTYCSFSPGGNFYSILGNNKLDNNNDGCDANDFEYNNLKISINDGSNTGFLIPDISGNYKVDVPVGTYTIIPILQNPNYYNVSPSSASFTFATNSPNAIQDFCITTNGAHQDVEVVIIPTNVARPGFDAKYKIIYKNKGNVIVSGNVVFNFSDAEVDFVSAIPAITTQNAGSLYWDYVNLQPLESREINVVLNMNSPQETPALNSGDNLFFEASITPFTNDEVSGDNIFEMDQTIVNSFDPNDKTCLEGNSIAPAKVGDYVHYVIRFENTGTFPAENIVVKDMIDTDKFDINSLQIVDGSHDFVTSLNGNKVEFIFENINLPFDNATNDGYVAFKIKTKSTLVLGNTFSNSANIYFDYNFPIITNTATTTVANPLANQDFEFSNYLKIYPNPAKNCLNIDNLKNIKISSIAIYNLLGQINQVVTNAENTKIVDVAELKSGNYFLKIVSDKGASYERFVKE